MNSGFFMQHDSYMSHKLHTFIDAYSGLAKPRALFTHNVDRTKSKGKSMFQHFCFVPTKETWPMLYHTSPRVSSVASNRARSKQVSVISYCWA